ncbi:PAS domain S-box-containing protein [Streptomyces ambofaciens]
MTEILDGREWTGVVPFRAPDETGGTGRPTGDRSGRRGLAEVYVMPTRTEDGEKAAVCIVVDVRVLRSIETDLAASQAIFGQSPFGFLLIDPDLRVRRANQRFASTFGGTPDDHRGKGVHDYLPRPEADRVSATLRRVLETGDSITDMHVTGFVPGTEERRHWSVNLYRVHSGSGRPIGVAWLGTDITARRQAAREAAAARRNLALLNEAGARIGNSLDLETTARELLDVVVPGFCDLATVDLYQGLLVGDQSPPGLADGSAELRRVAFSSAVSDAPFLGTGERVKLGAVHHYPFNSPCADALRTARPRSVPAEDGGLVQSTLAVPMVAHDTVVGLVQFARTKGSEPFGDRDRDLAVELAARAAVCIDNARLYRREHERALILQRSLLPPGDPEASGLDIACRYLPGEAATGRASEVGGDWFDVIELPGHRTALVVGDVMGRGLRAAVAMGELRTAVRTLAQLDLEPAEVLSQLDEIARGLGAPSGVQQATRAARRPREADLSEVYLATCVYAVYDSVTRRCTFANAGHLPPVLVEPGESALMLDVPPGLPLGVGGEPFEEVEVELPEGALLALYTDGLVESRDHPLDEGPPGLRGRPHRPHPAPGGRLRPGPQHPRQPPRRGRHRPADGPRPGPAQRLGRRLDPAARAAQRRAGPGVRPRAAARLGYGAAGRHHGTARQRTRHQRAPLRRGRDQTPPPARPHPGLRGLGLRPGPAAPAPRPRHRRGRPRPATGRPAQRGLGLTPYAARQDGLVRTAPAGRRHPAHRPGGGPAEPVLTRPGVVRVRARRVRRTCAYPASSRAAPAATRGGTRSAEIIATHP